MSLLCRWREQFGLLLLASFVAMATLVGLAGTASAASPAAYGITSASSSSAETRVAASAAAASDRVGEAERIAAGQRLGEARPQPGIASATGVAANGAAPAIKAGSEGGESAGRAFSQRVRQEALDENPNVCVYCRMETDRPQVDHVIPRSRGGNATLDNAQTTCWWCNASKGARDFPVNPPPGFEGMWPPSWWLLP